MVLDSKGIVPLWEVEIRGPSTEEGLYLPDTMIINSHVWNPGYLFLWHVDP